MSQLKLYVQFKKWAVVALPRVFKPDYTSYCEFFEQQLILALII